jgi:hypothetical protein
MRELGERGDGPLWWSADGPTDLLVKLAAWGDAPWRAALSFVSATSLSDLVLDEDTKMQLLRFDPAVAARDGFEAALKSVLAANATARADCARLYPVPDEATLETLLVDLEVDLGADAERRRRPIRPELIEDDRLCLNGGSGCGSVGYCASGEALFLVGDRPVVAVAPASLPMITEPIHATVPGSRRVPVKGRDDCVVHTPLETPRWVVWDGPCRDGVAEGEGVLAWGRDDEVIQRIDARADMDARVAGGRLVIEAPIDDYDFTLTICGAQSGYRRVRVDAPGDKRPAYFANDWLVDEILARAGLYADALCPMPRKGLSNIAVMIDDGDGNQVVRARNYDDGNFTWGERRNRAMAAMQRQLERDNRERRRAKAERLAQLREHHLKQRMEKGRAQIELAAENFLETGEGMFNHLACAVVYDDVATLERLEQGVAVTVAPAEAVRTVEVDGERYFAVRYRERSPYAQLEDQLREARRFSWATWFDQVQAQSAPQVTLDCLFERGAEIPDEEGSDHRVRGELVSFESSERGAHIVLRCRR